MNRMNAGSVNKIGRAGGSRRGFSLIELVVVMVMTAILAAVAIPATASLATSRRAVAARQMSRDLNFARQRALATGRTMWVVFSTSADTYTMLEEPVGLAGRTNATALIDPSTGRVFAEALNTGEYAGVDLSAVSFGGGSEVGFDWRGRPKRNDTTFLTSTATITITGATITIQPETGLATWQ